MGVPFSLTQLKRFKTSLRETSQDKSKAFKTELVSHDDGVYDFDAIAREVCLRYRSDICSSCDALYCNKGRYYLIEFKNQGRTNIKKDEIKKKAFDSVAVLESTLGWRESREELKDKMVFTVVYNSSLEERDSYVKFQDKLASLAGVERNQILFDLGNLKDLYSEIYTVDKGEFEDKLYPRFFG